VFTGILSGTACDQAVIRPPVWLFSAGLGFAFLGACVAYSFGWWGMLVLQKMKAAVDTMATTEFHMRELEAKGFPHVEDGPLQNQQDAAIAQLPDLAGKVTTLWRGAAIAIGLSVLAALAFASGVAYPALVSGEQFATCAAKK